MTAKESEVLKAAKKWAKQRHKTLGATHLGKARSRTALYERAEALVAAVKALEAK